jgi:Family of unknown function (DUF6159)
MFPILSAIFVMIALAAIGVPALIVSGVTAAEDIDQSNPFYYLIAAVAMYTSTFIAIFFNVALAACAARSLRGQDTTVGEGLRAARQRIGPILGWTLVACTVGLMLQVLQDRVPLAGRIATWIAEAAWSIATFFVVPVIALEGLGPIQALRRSVDVVKAKWGESAAGSVAITALTVPIAFLVALLGGAGAVLLIAMGLQPLGVAIIGATVAGVIMISVVSSALAGIFRVAVYEFAATGQTVAAFDSGLLQTAFDPHTRRR